MSNITASTDLSATDSYLFPQPTRPLCPSDGALCRQLAERNLQLAADLQITLRRYHNHVQPISFLPPEILLEVFGILRLEWGHEKCSGKRRRTKFKLAWISVSHVCHEWRELLLDLPALWKDINYHNAPIPWMKKMLDRAYPTPNSPAIIEFTVDVVSPGRVARHDEAFVDILSLAVAPQYAAGLMSLEITSLDADAILKLCKHTLPNLQKLALWNDLVDGAITTIHAETLASLVPFLEELTLSQFVFFWTPRNL
ncbi:hypothetical protein OF83DRAFT_193715 [Amylostereum chailletii]|nr:hypothetical protein OF83DRAFT_193715 [Amylostereum chailletii]